MLVARGRIRWGFIGAVVVACAACGETGPHDDGAAAGAPSGAGAGNAATAGAGAAPGGDGAGAPGTSGAASGGGGGEGGTITTPDRPDASTPDASTPDGGGVSADEAWSPLSVMAVVDPIDHGAVADGVADDLSALESAVDALPEAGGIVYLRAGAAFRKQNLLVITKSHVKLWSPNGQAELFQAVLGTRRRQSILCRDNDGCGFFGLLLRSDATERFDALEDNQISADHASLVEVVGCEIDGSAATGVFLYGSSEHYVHGNFVHHTWADHVHHTDGARRSWVWRNFVLNEEPSRGDDGVACVTYGPTSPTCGDMEWWSNAILHTDWGRGFSVIGGDDIRIHDNWAIGVAGAGIIVASEPSYDSASSHDVVIANNVVQGAGHAIGHPGILVSGLNTAAEPLRDIALRDNVVLESENGAYRAEGDYEALSNEGLETTADALPGPVPTIDDVALEDTSVLRTRDVSHVAAELRAGLHRIHVRPSPSGSGFEQRFEYVVKGPPEIVDTFAADRAADGGHVSESRTVAGSGYARLLLPEPVALPEGLTGVTFEELREAASRDLAWLWQRIDAAAD